MQKPQEATIEKMRKYAQKYRDKTGTRFSSIEGVTDAVILGLASHMEELGKPLCPCNFYTDKAVECRQRRWLCPCDEMQIFKYCHCLLFVGEDNLPITTYLPEGHEGLEMYGKTEDPAPNLGRAMRDRSIEDIMNWHKGE